MKIATFKDHGLSRNEIQTITKVLIQYWSKIEKVCLFGSRASGEFKDYSDIDIVLFGNIEEETVDRIYTLFDESMLGLSVDVKAYDHINYPPLKRHIENMAKILFTQDELKMSR